MSVAWTTEQVRAITAPGDVLLEASAGTGKTTTVIGRILWLLGLDPGPPANGQPLPPCPAPCTLEQVAAITFTEKAAYDLKAKLRREIEARNPDLRWEVDRASVGTIHAFCGELLRDHALRLGIDPTFRVLDERETRIRQDETIREVIYASLCQGHADTVDLVRRLGLYGSTHGGGAVRVVGHAVRDLRWRPERYELWTARPDGPPALDLERLRDFAVEGGIWAADSAADEERDLTVLRLVGALYRLAGEAASSWRRWMEEENVRDFDSLILAAKRLLTGPETRPALESIRRRYRTLIIDEFQDTDGVQRDIAFAIAGLSPDPHGAPAVAAEHRPLLFLVGDPKQSIYGFRGADIRIWNAVRDALCGEKEPLQLTHNFRSEPPVVDLVNRVCGRAIRETASALEPDLPESLVPYHALHAARPLSQAAGLEWLAFEGGNSAEKVEREAKLVASRIEELVRLRTPVLDPDTNSSRACRYRDVAVLGRKRKNLTVVERELRARGVPVYNAAAPNLAERQEVIDLVTVLRLLQNPTDDLRAFAFLRSPFVGLRDELLARIRLQSSADREPLLDAAERFLRSVSADGSGAVAAPESPLIPEVELGALERGLRAVRRAQELADRADSTDLLESVLEETGYRLHLLLRPEAKEALANIESFLALLEEYRHLPLLDFLALWDRWQEQDLGVPRAPLVSAVDDAVTLSTTHSAKGLEWPVVVLVGIHEKLGGPRANDFWSDPRLGPVFLPRRDDRGPWAEALADRREREERAEEARLLYVAATRARDRLIVCGSPEDRSGYAAWLAIALEGAVEEHELAIGETEEGDEREEASPSAEAGPSDRPAGTPDGGSEQLGLFRAPPEGSRAAVDARPAAFPGLVIRRRVTALQTHIAEPPVALWWLEGIERGETPVLARPVRMPRFSFLSSATERMLRERDPDAWRLRYRHGVEPVGRFAPDRTGGGEPPPALRGQVIHGVLERIEEEQEIARLLDETIADLGAPELEEWLAVGGSYREALEREIERVVRSADWRWYVEAPHHRELRFLHLSAPDEWTVGAFDLYRPAPAGDAPPGLGDAKGNERPLVWIVDFKTHRIPAELVPDRAAEYSIQASLYARAARELASEPTGVRVAFHFTHPNRAVRTL